MSDSDSEQTSTSTNLPVEIEESAANWIKMVLYIEQEGYEKADELNVKIEDEFVRRKHEIIEKECTDIDIKHIDKCKDFKQKHKTELALMTSTCRKKLITIKHQALEELQNQILDIVAKDMKCATGNWTILKLLIMEGLFKLLENKVLLRCREQDVEIIKKNIPELEMAYLEKAKKKVEITVDSVYLPDDNIPGIIMYVKNNRIILENLLRERVIQIFQFFVPAICEIFYD